MSLFAYHFARGLLNQAGWPRKLGLFKGEGYDVVMVDEAYGQAMDWGAALGAERPSLALQMIAEIFFPRDWEGEDAPDMKGYVEELRDLAEKPWETAASPQEALALPRFAGKGGSALSVEHFERLELKRAMEGFLLAALAWGLDHPDRFEAWYSSQAAEAEAMLPLAEKAGVEVDNPSLAEYVENCAQLVRHYELLSEEQLPPVPPRLLADAEALGWRV